jgi:hypothetical protein
MIWRSVRLGKECKTRSKGRDEPVVRCEGNLVLQAVDEVGVALQRTNWSVTAGAKDGNGKY